MTTIKMKYLAAILLAALFLVGCADKEESTETALTDLTTFDGLSSALGSDQDLIVYDVRTPAEYAAGHIPGAINIPHDVITDRIDVEDKDATIVLYCRSGNRSGVATRGLKALGFTGLVDFGGINKWQGSLVTGDSPR